MAAPPPLTLNVSLPTPTVQPRSKPARPRSNARAVRRTLNLSIIEGGLVQVFLNWTTGSVIIGYMLHLGASATEIGLIASVPMLAQLASPFAAYLGGVAGRLKAVTALTAFLGRGLWLLAAFLPLLGVPAEWRPAFVVGLIMVSSFFQASTATLWTLWMGGACRSRGGGATSVFGRVSSGWSG